MDRDALRWGFAALARCYLYGLALLLLLQVMSSQFWPAGQGPLPWLLDVLPMLLWPWDMVGRLITYLPGIIGLMLLLGMIYLVLSLIVSLGRRRRCRRRRPVSPW